MRQYHRKSSRLKNYDYSKTGAYFITICTKNRAPILSTIVGAGSARPDTGSARPDTGSDDEPIYPHIVLTPLGEIVEKYIIDIHEYYPNIVIDQYVIMPDHVHLLLIILSASVIDGRDLSTSVIEGRANPAPTIGNVIGRFKFLTTKEMANYLNISDNHIWQRSYHDHIIRDEQDYFNTWNYIKENPLRGIQNA